MAEYYQVLYQIKQHDLIKDRDITIKATTWQRAVDKVKAKIKDLHKIEQVSIGREDEHGVWFENYYPEQSFREQPLTIQVNENLFQQAVSDFLAGKGSVSMVKHYADLVEISREQLEETA